MRLSALVCAMLCLFTTTKSAYAQQLADLQHIAIVIDLSKETERVGLTKQSVTDTVLVGLKRGAPKLKIDSTPPVSVFYVKITSVVDGTASFVAVDVVRPGEIVGDNGSNVYSGSVPVWHRGSLLTGSTDTLASQIRESINDAVAAFAAQYHKDNP